MTEPHEPTATAVGSVAGPWTPLLPGQRSPGAPGAPEAPEAAVPAASATSPALPRPRQVEVGAGATPPASSPAPSRHDWEAYPWRTVLRVTASRALLGVAVGLLVWALLPMAIGWTPRVILSGSMEPRISTGDVVVTRGASAERIAELAAPTVITTDDPDKPGRTRTHRVLERDADGLIVTQGDANPAPDSTPVADADVLGIGVLRVPFVGLPAYWVAVRDTVPLGVSFLVLSGLVLGSLRPQGAGTGTGSGAGGDRGGAGAGRSRRAARTGGAGAALLAIVATTVVGGQASYAALSATAPTGTSVFSAAAAFAQGYATVVAADGALLHWRMDQASGSTVGDETGRHPATVSGGQYSWGQPGALLSEPGSTALQVNGARVQQNGTLPADRNWAVEVWVRVNGGGGPLMTLVGGSAINRAVYVGNDGIVRLGTGTGSALATGSTRVNDGRWHHVVVTGTQGGGAPNQRARIYVDGRQDGVGRNVENDTTAGSWRAAQAQWGNNVEGGPDQFFRGTLDEVAVYDYTLSAQQAAAHHAAGGY